MVQNKSPFGHILFAPQEGTVRFPAFKTIFGPYMMFIDQFRTFALIGGIYAAVMAVVYLLSGQAMFCSFAHFDNAQFCSSNLYFYFGSRLVALVMASAFCLRYYQAVWQQQEISWAMLLRPQKRDLPALAAIIIFLVLNAAAFLSWYLLSVRIPNPDWRIELTYFAFAGSGFLVPFILLRFYSVLAYIWSGEKIPSLWQIWKRSGGNTLRLLLGVTLWFFVFVFFLSAILMNFGAGGSSSPAWVMAGEYIFNLSALLMTACFVNFCGLQKMFLSESEKNDTEKND